jgi:hypothetical protein
MKMAQTTALKRKKKEKVTGFLFYSQLIANQGIIKN